MNNLNTVKMETLTLIKGFFRQKNNVVWAVIIPIILCTTCAFVISAVSEKEAVIYIQDQDDNNVTKDIIDSIGQNATVVMVDKTMSKEDALKKMRSDSRNPIGLIIIPEGFRDDWYVPVISETEEGKMMLYYEGGSIEIGVKITPTPSGNPGEPTIVLEDFLGSSAIKEIFGNSNLYEQFCPIIILGVMCALVLGLTIGTRTAIRTSRIPIMLKNTDLKRWHTLIANMLWAFIPTTISVVICYIILNLFSHISFNFGILLILILSSLCITSIGLVFSMLVRSTPGATIAASAIVLPMIITSGGVIPLYMLPDWALFISYFSPMTYMVSGFKYSLGLNSTLNLATSIIAIIGITALFSIIWIVSERKNLR